MINANLKQPQSGKDLITLFFDKVWGGDHDLNIIDQLMSQDYQITTGGQTITGRENFKDWVKSFQEKLIDAKTQSLEFIETDDKVVSRWVCTGKNNGIFGLEPTHNEVSFTGIAIWKVINHQLVECWVERSALELYVSIKKT